MHHLALWALALTLALPVAAQPSSSPEAPEDSLLLEAALAFEQLVNGRDAKAIDAALDAEGTFRRIEPHLRVSPQTRDELREAFRTSYALGARLASSLGDNGDYTFLGFFDRGGETRARYRLIDDGDAVNYHDVAFDAGASGRYRVVDWFPLLNGEDYSVTTGRLFQTLIDEETFSRAEVPPVSALVRAYHRGEHQTVFETYPTISLSPEDRRGLAGVYVQSALQLGPAEFAKALDHYESLYGTDPTLDLLQLDRLYTDGRLDELLEAVARLDEAVGGDPYLDVFRVTAWSGLEQHDEALAAATRLIDAFPAWPGGLDRRVGVALDMGAHEIVLNDMVTLEQDFGWTFDADLIRKNWPAFAASPQFVAWQARIVQI